MKISNEGDVKLTYPWWTRLKWTCAACRFEAELDPDDARLVNVRDGERHGISATMTCPTCGAIVTAYKPEPMYNADQWGR